MNIILEKVQKFLFFWILGAIIAGLAVVKITGGYTFSPAICFLAALVMIYPSLVPLEFNNLKTAFRDYRIILISLTVNFIVAPAAAYVLGMIFLSDQPALQLGLILLSILPGGGMVTTWAYKSKSDMPVTIGIVFLNLMAALIFVPVYLSLALNWAEKKLNYFENEVCVISEVTNGSATCFLGGQISPLKLLIPIIAILVIPLIFAFFTQRIIKAKKGVEYFELIKRKFAVFSNLGLIIVLFLLMAIKDNAILFERPDLVAQAFIPLLLFYLFSFLVSFTIFNFYKDGRGKAFVWGTYLRYITLALGLAISLIYQNSEFILMIVVIVMAYFIQIPTSFWLANYFNSHKSTN